VLHCRHKSCALKTSRNITFLSLLSRLHPTKMRGDLLYLQNKAARTGTTIALATAVLLLTLPGLASAQWQTFDPAYATCNSTKGPGNCWLYNEDVVEPWSPFSSQSVAVAGGYVFVAPSTSIENCSAIIYRCLTEQPASCTSFQCLPSNFTGTSSGSVNMASNPDTDPFLLVITQFGNPYVVRPLCSALLCDML
jgi:hypothetical protein